MSFETSKIIHSDPTYEKPAHILEPISFYTVIFVFQIKKSPYWFSDNHPTRTFGWVSFLSRFSVSPLPTWFARWRIYMLCRRPRRCRFDPWVRKMPWRRKWQSTPVFLPGKSHGQRSLAVYSPRGRKESDTTEWLSTHVSINISGEERERILFFFLIADCCELLNLKVQLLYFHASFTGSTRGLKKKMKTKCKSTSQCMSHSYQLSVAS